MIEKGFEHLGIDVAARYRLQPGDAAQTAVQINVGDVVYIDGKGHVSNEHGSNLGRFERLDPPGVNVVEALQRIADLTWNKQYENVTRAELHLANEIHAIAIEALPVAKPLKFTRSAASGKCE